MCNKFFGTNIVMEKSNICDQACKINHESASYSMLRIFPLISSAVIVVFYF